MPAGRDRPDRVRGGARVPRALQQHVGPRGRTRDRRRAHVERLGGAERRAPARAGAGSRRSTTTYAAPSARAGLDRDQPDRPGAGDQHPRAGATPPFRQAHSADRQRLQQGGRVVAERVRDRVRELLVLGDHSANAPSIGGVA